MAAILAALVRSHCPRDIHPQAEVFQLEKPNLHPLFPSQPPLAKFKCPYLTVPLSLQPSVALTRAQF
jgi:hypothetical protein